MHLLKALNVVATASLWFGASAAAIDVKPRWTGGLSNRAVAHANSLDVLGRAVQLPEKRYLVPLLARQANGTATNTTAPAVQDPAPAQGGQDEEGKRREQEENQRQQEAAQRQQEEEQRYVELTP